MNGNLANFRPAVRVGDLVFVSGQASVDETGRIVPGTFAEELHRAIGNLRRILADHDLTLSDVVKVGAYVDDPTDVPEFNRLYRDYFTDPLPTRTTITNCLGGHVKFEIDAVAHRRSPTTS